MLKDLSSNPENLDINWNFIIINLKYRLVNKYILEKKIYFLYIKYVFFKKIKYYYIIGYIL